MDASTLSDEALIGEYRKARPDEKRKFVNELFARHYERVARWCYRFTGDRESAADLAQEVFLRAHRHLDSFQGTSRFTTWLYSIARNESWTALGKRAAAPVDDTPDALVEVPALDPSPEQSLAVSSQNQRLHDFLRTTLDGTERVVFTLHYGEEMPLDTITRLLALQNASGAKAFIVSARRKLARAVQRLRARGEAI